MLVLRLPTQVTMALHKYDWILGLITISFCISAFSNGANDVANSYATSVAARTLTMPQAGVLAAITEFVGAVALGSRVTKTIKSGIIDIKRFNGRPGVLMLAMACAETGSAFWLALATRLGFPVSTTQTIIGALVGVGFASQASISWGWKKGSVSQTAASWGIAPAIAAGFSAIIFATLKFGILERQNSMAWAMRLIPLYLSMTCAILALFIVVQTPTAPSLEAFGAGKAVGIILGVLFGCLLISYVFFVPYFHRRLVQGDKRIRAHHIILGPLLLRDDPPLFWTNTQASGTIAEDDSAMTHTVSESETIHGQDAKRIDGDLENNATVVAPKPLDKKKISPEERFLAPNRHLPKYHPRRLTGYLLYGLLHGVTVDCVDFSKDQLADIHSKARTYDAKVEHLWTYPQMLSAIMMSIAHGSNDVSNAIGPWAAAYDAWKVMAVRSDSDTPIWMLVVAGLLLGIGFWFFGYHIIRQLGNKLTKMSPTRGFSIELGAAITVLLASRLSLPVSTTQCLTGAAMGVALMNLDTGAVNWKAMVWIFGGWVFTLPCAGLIAGLLMLMSLNTPHF